MLTYVGFTPEYISPECTYRIAIFTREKADELGLFVPTFLDWVHQLRKRFDLDLRSDVVREVS